MLLVLVNFSNKSNVSWTSCVVDSIGFDLLTAKMCYLFCFLKETVNRSLLNKTSKLLII